MAEIDTDKLIPYLKKASAWIGGLGGIVTAGYLFVQKDYPGAFTALSAGLAAFGLNLPVHAQVKAAK